MTLIILIITCLVIAAGFEGAETSLLSISEVRLRTLSKKGDRRADTVLKLRSNVRILLGTLLLGQTVCDIVAASLAALFSHGIFGDAGIAAETAIMTVIVLVFVNLIPKSHAAQDQERWALISAYPVFVLTVVLSPLVKLIDRFVSLFVRGNGAATLVTEEEIRTMTLMGVTSGSVERGEKELIDRVFLFNDITANDVLTPREYMVTLDANMPVSEAVSAVDADKYSRYPVLDDNGAVSGIVHIKDLLGAIAHGRTDGTTVGSLAALPVMVTDDTLIDDLFRRMKRERVHMAIVENPQNGIVGLITLEDLLEELVGEIADESDIDEYVIKRIDKYTLLVHGDTDIPDVNRFFNTKIDGGDVRTIGRYVRGRAGKSAKPGQPVMIGDNLMAIIEEANRDRVLRVRLIKSGDHQTT